MFFAFRELWRKIYRGNDIDYVEIKTEGDISVNSDRRKYDYRYIWYTFNSYTLFHVLLIYLAATYFVLIFVELFNARMELKLI